MPVQRLLKIVVRAFFYWKFWLYWTRSYLTVLLYIFLSPERRGMGFTRSEGILTRLGHGEIHLRSFGGPKIPV